MNKKVKIESRRIVYDDFFKIEEAYVRREGFDGQLSDPFRILSFERGDGAAALLFNIDTQRLILINQFRYPTYANGQGPGWIIEIIAGTVAAGEDPQETIRREITEETGYYVDELTPITTFYPSPGGSSERLFVYYAEVDNHHKIESGGGLATEHEDIQIVEYTLPDAWQALAAGQIVDAKTIIALMWL
ncbi:MAG: NUDIX hydrolase, partial [Anaerolineae bacterium]|nr:NUDIX hydrolase [Anaerolineae bacterium]